MTISFGGLLGKFLPHKIFGAKMVKVSTGLDNFGQVYWRRLKNKRLGLLANQASVNQGLISTKEIISDLLPDQLKVIFGPQHGFRGEDQDNMIETDEYWDKDLNIPVYTAYGSRIDKIIDIFDDIDLLIIDLQDVGTRVYTFISTMLYFLKACSERGKDVIVLDRPNPLGGEIVEGNILQPEFFSFVGPYSLPMRHGMTIAEIAYLFRDAFELNIDINVAPLSGWKRSMLWNDTGLRWIMPSPNMPLFETALVYPGQVIWEGTNISEGRGTCRPFELFGAPFINPTDLKKSLNTRYTEGCLLQCYSFRPTFNKWKGILCHGFMIHVLNPQVYRPYQASLAILKGILEIYKDNFSWIKPPYEYVLDRQPVDIITGDSLVRIKLEKENGLNCILESCSKDRDFFLESRKSYLLYR
jgi:uncharacterized protein YbbC (DUF1343 family)